MKRKYIYIYIYINARRSNLQRRVRLLTVVPGTFTCTLKRKSIVVHATSVSCKTVPLYLFTEQPTGGRNEAASFLKLHKQFRELQQMEQQQQQRQQKVRPVSDARKQSCVFLWRMWAYSKVCRHFRIRMLSQQGVLPTVCLGVM